MKIPRFALIIGAMKCGTTSLYNYLVQHPQIAGCSREKEPNFFANDQHWARGADWYESLWDWQPTRHQWAMEASTYYTKIPQWPNAAARIAEYDAEFKFIYVMRDPVDRVRSHFHHGLYAHWFSQELSVDEAIEQHDELLAPSRYATQLDEYVDRFGRDSLHLLTLEQLKEQPEQVLRDICRFLDIDDSVEFGQTTVRHNSGASRINDAVIVRYLRKIEPLRQFVQQATPVALRSRLRRLLAAGRPDIPAPTVTDAQRRAIGSQLADEMRRLGEDYGLDVDQWPSWRLLQDL